MRKLLLLGLKGLLAAATLGYLVYMIEVDALLVALERVDPLWVAIALGLVPVVVGLDAAVWRELLRPILPTATPSSVLRAVLSGSALGLITPARVGEFAGRALFFPEADSWSISATVFAQRVIDTALCAGLGLGALGYGLYVGWLPATAGWAAIAGTVGVACIVLMVFVSRPTATAHWIQRLFPEKTQWHERIAFLEQLDRASGWRIVRFGLLRQGVFCALFASLVIAFGPSARPLDILIGILLVFLAKFLLPSVTLLDLGVREGAAVFFLGAVGVGEAAAFNAALLMFVFTGVLPALAGLPYALRLRIGSSPVLTNSSA